MSHRRRTIHADVKREKMERIKFQDITLDNKSSIWEQSRNTLKKAWNKKRRPIYWVWPVKTDLQKEKKIGALAALEEAANNGQQNLAQGANLVECAELMASRKGITAQDILAIESIRKKADFELYRIAKHDGTVFKPASLREVVSAITAKARGAGPKAGREKAIIAVWEAECPLLPQEKERLEKELANGKAMLERQLAILRKR